MAVLVSGREGMRLIFVAASRPVAPAVAEGAAAADNAVRGAVLAPVRHAL
jgi:hypothetical protein